MTESNYIIHPPSHLHCNEYDESLNIFDFILRKWQITLFIYCFVRIAKNLIVNLRLAPEVVSDKQQSWATPSWILGEGVAFSPKSSNKTWVSVYLPLFFHLENIE